MSDPVLVEVTRGERVESRHRGAVIVCDAVGKTVLALGDVDQPIYPRSAVKTIQALALVETGAADALGLGDTELALCCASHAGEPAHVETAAGMLAKVGKDNATLECGSHWPSNHDAMVALAKNGDKPSALHNNCSGKHSGFICLCCHADIDPTGYIGPDHWLQQTVRSVMEEVTDAPHDADNRGIDGCSIPTYAVPLKNLALGFARMATGQGLGDVRARAAKRLLDACMAYPFYTAGTGRMDVKLMEASPGRIFVKTGAEGVYCGAVPELGLGIALKCDDGAGRASETAMASVLESLFKGDAGISGALHGLATPTLRNWKGTTVGTLRPAGELAKGFSS